MPDLAEAAAAHAVAGYINGADRTPPVALNGDPAPPEAPVAPAPAVPPRPGRLSIARAGLPPIRAYGQDVVAMVQRAVEETTKPFTVIAAETGVSASVIKIWTTLYGWVRPAGAPMLRGSRRGFDPADRRERLAARLYRALARQLAGIERRGREGGDELIEKDARTLGVLAKTLETLKALDREDGAETDAPEPADRERFNAELARKIERWAAGGDEPARTGEEPFAG